MHKKIALYTTAALLVSAATVFAATELARINNNVISIEEFNNKYRESLKFFRYKTPTKKNVIDELVNRDLAIQEAKRLKLDRDPEVIDRMNTVLYQALIDKTLTNKLDAIVITSDEVEEYYKQNPEVRTSHLFVQVPFDANKNQEKTAREKMQKIKGLLDEALSKGDKTFAEIAKMYSEGVAAPMGGDIDYQTKDKLDPVYYSTALQLKKPGAVSDVVRTQFGYHIIKLTAVKPFKDADPGQIRRQIYEEKRQKLFDGYLAELRQKAKVTVRYDLLKESE